MREAGSERSGIEVIVDDAIERVKSVQLADERHELFESAIDQDDAGTILDRALHRDGTSRAAACAEDHHAQVAQVRAEFRADGAHEAGAVRVVADEFFTLDRDRVHDADPPRMIIRAIDERERRELVRDGAIHTDESLRGQQAKGFREFLRADVQPRVTGVDAARGERGIVHRRRGRMRDGIAQDREAERRLPRRPRAQVFERIDFFHPANVEAARAMRASTRSRPRTSSMW